MTKIEQNTSETTQATGLYRTLFEMSSMANNEEFVIHTGFPLREPSEFEKSGEYDTYLREVVKLRWGAFSRPCPYFCREVLPIEIEEGLDLRYNGYLEKVWDQIPEVTKMIDGIYKMLVSVRRLDRHGMSPVKALLLYIASNYYDCIMSSGMPRSALLMARELILRYDIDRSLQIYPKSADPESSEDLEVEAAAEVLASEPVPDAWYTVQDFLESTKDIEPIDAMKLLPPGVFRLGPGV